MMQNMLENIDTLKQHPFDEWYRKVLVSSAVTTMADSNYLIHDSNFRILNLPSGYKLLATQELALKKFVLSKTF